MDAKKAYQNLTGVNADTVNKNYSESRASGYNGEFRIFSCFLHDEIFHSMKILMNLNVPVSGGGTTEIDLLVISECGIICFEIKNYTGRIYGKVGDEKLDSDFQDCAKPSIPQSHSSE